MNDEAASAPGAAPRLSIVLAVLNERANLPELFDRLRAVPLPPWEAIVADDGSTDGSREFVSALAERDLRIRLLPHDGRQTTLTAQCGAIATARGELVAIMDADLQHPPELVQQLVRAADDGATLVVASRYAPGGTPGPRSPVRILISRVAEYTARALLPPARRVTDPVSGFFVFRRSAFVPLPPDWRGYKLLLFVLAMTDGLAVREVPFRFEPRTGGSTKVAKGFDFIRLFLIETILARRFSARLDRRGRPGERTVDV